MTTLADSAQAQLLAFPLASLAALRAALIRDTGEAGATHLQEAGYAGGESMFRAFGEWLAGRDMGEPEGLTAEAFAEQAAEFFRAFGWGSVTITPLHDVVAMVDSENWSEADPAIGMPYPSCHFTTGLFADFFGRTAAAPLAVLETECRSSGAPHCRFLVGSAEVMGHLYERMAAGVSYSDAAAELVQPGV
jgi:predicted hydrocarbon binding protein